MELCDTFDATGTPTGRILARGTKLAPGEYFMSVQVWLRDEAGEYLIQQRALHLASGPGIWATTAGYVWAGESSVTAALREVNEELGLTLLPDQLTRFDRNTTEYRLEDVWIASVSKASIHPVIGEEVAAWKWASKAALQQMVTSGEFFPYSYFHRLPA